MKRCLALIGCAVLVGAALWVPSPASAKTVLIYTVKEARAYAYKASLSKETIELIGQVNRCDPKEDPYECDESKYKHKENCPKKLQIGRSGKAPRPKPPQAEPFRGRAGDHAGPEQPPLQSSPVRINRLLSLASIGDLAGVLEAGGLASSLYVDLSGRSEPEGHTESEAFTNRADYEERCYPQDEEGNVDENAYEHFLSRSFERPETYHLSECFERQCQFGAGFNAEHARAIAHLAEKGGRIVGTLRAYVDGLTYAEGAFTLDSLVTYVKFSSDGTKEGLKWSAVTTASGGKIGDNPVALPPGRSVSGPGFSVGVAEPYVDATKSGAELTVVAPGLHFGSEQQSAFFGGAEVYAGMNRDTPFSFNAPEAPEPPAADPLGGGGAGFPGTGAPAASFGSGPLGGAVPDGGDISDPVAIGEPGEVLVYEIPTGIGIVPTIIVLGAVGWLLLLSRWLQRYTWGRRMLRIQPFKSIDWIYRAFVKT